MSSPHTQPPPAPAGTFRERLAGARVILRQLPGTIRLVWQADRAGAVGVLALTLVLALLPAAIAWGSAKDHKKARADRWSTERTVGVRGNSNPPVRTPPGHAGCAVDYRIRIHLRGPDGPLR